MRTFLAAFFAASLCLCVSAAPLGAGRKPGFEIVRNHIEIELQAGGAYLESREIAYRVLTEEGAAALRQMTFSYTQDYQDQAIRFAYTLKKDGTRIDVDSSRVLSGFGATSAPGFQDLKTRTVVFPNLEVGDQVVVSTVLAQHVPWFGDAYADQFVYGRETPTHDVEIAVTAPSDLTLHAEAIGFSAEPPASLGGKTRHVWRFDNPVPTPAESEAVDDYDSGARLVLSSFGDYRALAQTYADAIKDRAAPTPEIRALAEKLTQGIKDPREQVHVLYDWVALHIAYLDIVLGAGGFIPHRAAEVLANKYGDCKDHAILLQALLAAKGIESTPVLINAGERYTLSNAPSPFSFNHMISYVPKLKLYLDSTSRYASFGTLPYQDADKPVVLIDSGTQARTQSVGAAGAVLKSVEHLAIAADGSAEGETQVTASGSASADLRAAIAAIHTVGETAYFERMIGTGVEAEVQGGDDDDLAAKYGFSVHYRQAAALPVPGPATVPVGLAYKPFSFTLLIAPDLPASRTRQYLCRSATAEEDLTIDLPDTVSVMSLPRSETLTAEDIKLTVAFDQPAAHTIHGRILADVNHPRATCTPEYYARNREALARMASALRAQILYR